MVIANLSNNDAFRAEKADGQSSAELFKLNASDQLELGPDGTPVVVVGDFIIGEQALSFVPKPVNTGSNMAAGAGATTAILGYVGAVLIPLSIEVRKITYNITTAAANANNVQRVAIYDQNGVLLINATDAAGTATGERTITLGTPVTLSPGIYYVLICQASGTGDGAIISVFDSSTAYFTGGVGELDLSGTYTIVAGAAPDPLLVTAITTPAADATPGVRLN